MNESDAVERVASSTSPGLHDYQARKLDLADIVRNAMDLARERRDERSQAAGRELLARLASDRFDLAVLGQFSRGKSTLMNAIIGHPYLPTGARPTTSVVTSVRYGDRPRALVHQRGHGIWTPAARGLAFETPIDQLAGYVTRLSQQDHSAEITRVDVELPAEILRLGFNFVDTPGVGSAIRANTEATEQFLPQADAVILVTSVDSPLAEVELEFLKRAIEYGTKLFLVVNKIDLLSEPEVEAALGFVRGEVDNVPGLGEARIFPLSARDGLEAKQASDPNLLMRSGLAAFESTLVDFLTHQKAKEFLRRACDRALVLIRRQRLYAEIAARAESDTGAHADRLVEFGRRLDQIVAEEQRSLDELKARIDVELPARLEMKTAPWAAELQERLLPEFDSLWPVAGTGVAQADFAEVSRRLVQVAEDALCEAHRRRTSETDRCLNELVGETMAGLKAPARLVESAAADAFGASSSPPDTPEDATAALPPLATYLADWSFAIRLPWWQPVGLRIGLGASFRRQAREQLQEAIVVYAKRAASQLLADARQWADALGEELQTEARETADRLTSVGSAPERREDVGRLDQMEQRLLEIRGEVSGWPTESPDEAATALSAPPATAIRPAHPWRCVVCASLARAQFDHLRLSQYDLATHPERQAEHAAAGGFCAFHTWIYSDVASPVGIAAGYASLAAAIGEALHALNNRARGLDDLVSGLARLTATSDRCPVCRVLDRATQESVAAVIEALDHEPGNRAQVSLCVPHVLKVLEARPGHGRAQRLVAELTEALIRRSEDMRIYALKRDALRKELVSADEENAAMECLALLAGRPDLARRYSGPIEISVD